MSRFIHTPKIRYLDKEVLSKWSNYDWLVNKPASSDILTFKVTTQTAGEARRIAQTLYGDHNLYWILHSFNARWYNDSGALNVFGWPIAGQVIFYPVRTVFISSLS